MSNRDRFDKDNIKKGLVLAGALCIVVLFYLLIGKIGVIFAGINKLLNAMSPVIIGCIIAFLLNPIENVFEKWFRKFFAWSSRKKPRTHHKGTASKTAKHLAVACTMLVFVALIFTFLRILIPQLRDSIMKLYDNIPSYIDSIEKFGNRFLKKNPDLENVVSEYLDNAETNVQKMITDRLLPNMDTIIKTVSTGIVGGLKFVLNFIIGIIAAIYILGTKDVLSAQGKKIIYAIFNKKRGNSVLHSLDRINVIFSGFINGKIVDSIIIGILCAIFCAITKMPYGVLISVIVGVTNIIPFFGPFIGAVPSIFLVLVESPKMCVVFIIFIIVLQQVDGNVIGPLILGDSTGLSSFWVLFAILVGGNLFGFAGMLLGVPVFACIYTLVTVMLRDGLEKRGLTNKTSYYKNLRGFDQNGKPIHGPKLKTESPKARRKRLQQMERLQKAGVVFEKVTHAIPNGLRHEEDGEGVNSEKDELPVKNKAIAKNETIAKNEAATKDEGATKDDLSQKKDSSSKE